MTVRDLKDLLNDYNDDSIVLMQTGNNSHYVESIYGIEEKEVSAFFGDDYEALILVANKQVGGV